MLRVARAPQKAAYATLHNFYKLHSLYKPMADKITLPSGQGGLTRYFDESRSKFQFSPSHIVVICVIIVVLLILLNAFGGTWLY